MFIIRFKNKRNRKVETLTHYNSKQAITFPNRAQAELCARNFLTELGYKWEAKDLDHVPYGGIC